ncbi:MAG TPA: TIGR02996 domain-containing protein [Gemmata sp.]
MDADERALLNAIIAQPDEDTPRLVYADWLQEHDQPERAEYIRLSIELANLRYGEPGFEERTRQLYKQLWMFETFANKVWPGELAKRLPATRDLALIFRRGFACWVRCSVSYFLTNADAIFHEAPVHTFSPNTLTPASAKRLVADPQFQRLKAVHCWRPDLARALLRCSNVEIGALDFAQPTHDSSGYWDELAVAVAAHPGVGAVKRINFENCGLGNLAGACLADARFITPDVLNLLGNNLEERVKVALRQRYGARVWLDEADRAGTRRGDRL